MYFQNLSEINISNLFYFNNLYYFYNLKLLIHYFEKIK